MQSAPKQRCNANMNTVLSEPAGTTISLTTYFRACHSLQQSQVNNVWTTAHLDSGPNLTVSVNQKQKAYHDKGDNSQTLRHDN